MLGGNQSRQPAIRRGSGSRAAALESAAVAATRSRSVGRPLRRLSQAIILLRHVKCKSRSPAADGAYDRASCDGSAHPATRSSARRRDEALDALVAVLDEIRLGPLAVARRSSSRGPASAAAIVAQRVGELLERGLVIEGESGPSTGGRPPRQLTFRADAGHVLVADLGATSHRRRGDHARRPDPRPPRRAGRHRRRAARRASRGGRAVRRAARARRAACPGRLWGVGIGVPGPVEFRTGRPISPPIMPGWDGYPVRERFADRYGAPVWVDNDVNVLALGEWRSGVAAGHDNVVVVKVGTGIGAGIISDGRLHRGAQGCAGDVGPHPGRRRPDGRSAAAATSAASRRWPAARRSAATGEAAARDGPERAAARRRWTSTGR